ncbi:MAG: type II toxin-antitoxin system HicB family antitoxin [Clostridia bacterium]|nr:type II toxin-antitoxin system HicB family antitoxin [Clostridia bacterium]
MAKYVYPAIFKKDGDFIFVEFPDFESCYTQGESIIEAMEMATDVLCLTLYDMEEGGKTIPAPSEINSIVLSENDDSFISLVACDTIEYRKFYDNKAIKKTLTIPSWLNTMAERKGVNFSQVLQDALKAQINA